MGWLDFASILALLIEIGLPIALAVWVWKKYRVSWAIFFLGMALFLLSLIRMPLNNWVTLIVQLNFSLETYVILTALFASFTAALFEEGVRVLGLGLIIKGKTYHKGLMYGIGHGRGGEAMVMIGFSGLANYIVYKFMPGLVPGVPWKGYLP
ncbi:MAG: YhfC family glutamic-type intramembrane protease [Actinomycetota bacterium]|nr:YhfC family glutamic-type intramembrane protease [Actinomycetota bacterium]